MLEPILENKPIFENKSPSKFEASRNESMMEPNSSNLAYFDAKKSEIGDERHESLIEPINDNQAIFK
jgi:hypothetical protein